MKSKQNSAFTLAEVVGDDAYADRPDHNCGTTTSGANFSGLGCSALYLQNQ